MTWCTGPCGRLLSVVAFSRGDVCGRCRDITAHARARGLAAYARHLALPTAERVAHRRGRTFDSPRAEGGARP